MEISEGWPSWFFDDGVTDEDRNRWLTQRRCLRQAMKQDTPYARMARKRLQRQRRITKARDSTVDLSEHR